MLLDCVLSYYKVLAPSDVNTHFVKGANIFGEKMKHVDELRERSFD